MAAHPDPAQALRSSEASGTKEDSDGWVRAMHWLRVMDAIAPLAWLYVFLKLFVTDIDRTAIESFAPDYAWISDFRVVFFAMLTFSIGLFFWRRLTVILVLYGIFWPVIVIAWKIPTWIYRRKSWLLAMSALNFVMWLALNLRFHILTKSLVLICVIIIWNTTLALALIACGIVLSGALAWLLWQTILETFSEGAFLKTQKKVLFKLSGSTWGTVRLGNITSVRTVNQTEAILTEQQIGGLLTGISLDLAVNRILYFWSWRLQCYHQSQLSHLFNSVTYARLFLSTVMTAWLLNTVILKVDPAQFTFETYPGPIRVVAYSLSSLFLNDGGGMDANGDAAWLFRVISGIFGVLLLLTFVANFLFVLTRERDDRALKEAVNELRSRAREHDAAFRAQVEVSVAEAEQRLEELNRGLAWLIRYITVSIPPEFIEGRGDEHQAAAT
jgi:hypothetical protein